MLTVKSILSQIQSRDWFVTIDLKDTYFHIQIVKRHRKFPFSRAKLTNTVFSCLDCHWPPEHLQSVWTTGHLHFELLRRLANISSIPRSGTMTSRLSSQSSTDPGTTNEPTKECSAALPANNIFGGRHGFSHDACTSVSCTCAVITDLCKSVQDRMSSPGRSMSQIVGSDGGSIPCNSAGSAPYATDPVVDQQPEYFTSLSSASKNYGDTQRSSCSKTVEKTPVPSERSPAVSLSSSQNYHDGRLGGSPSRTPSLVSLVRRAAELAHKSFGTAGSLPASQRVEFLPQLMGYHVLISTDNMTVVSYLNCQGGLCSRSLYRLARSFLLWAQAKFLSVRAVYIPSHLNSGPDLLSRQRMENGGRRLHTQLVNLVWQRFGRAKVDLFASSTTTYCPLWFSPSPLLSLGLDAFAQEWPRTSLSAFPPIRLLPVIILRVRLDQVKHLLLVAPWWPSQSWFLDLVSLSIEPPWEIPLRHDRLTQARDTIWHPRPDLWRLWVWPLSGMG